MESVKILETLKKTYPAPKIALKYSTPFQLLIATILSAQCTDERVNKVTDILFKKYKTVRDFAKLNREELEKLIRSTGFYKNKAKNIILCSQELVDKYDGFLPETVEQLSKLPGVGRKTANVVLSECFNKQTIVVDTHIKRFSNRIGLTTFKDPVKIEFDLMEKLPEEEWSFFSKAGILHGRNICKSRKPLCNECILEHICPKKI